MPVYNEQVTVREIIQRVLALKLDLELIIIDDCSTDGTSEILNTLDETATDSRIKILYHAQNQGKGAAIRTGIRNVNGDVVVVQDADLEYDPTDLPDMLQPILDGKADAVYGSRLIGRGPHRVLFFWHMLGNKFLTLLFNIFTNLNLTDMESCYKMVRTDILKHIKIEQNRFGFEPEITAKLARIKGIRLYEIGISYFGRSYEEGKKITWKDGFQAIWCILKYWIVR